MGSRKGMAGNLGGTTAPRLTAAGRHRTAPRGTAPPHPHHPAVPHLHRTLPRRSGGQKSERGISSAVLGDRSGRSLALLGMTGVIVPPVGRGAVRRLGYRLIASRRSPEPPQRSHVRAVAQLLERALADLADALARDAEERADLLERHRLGAFLEPVVEGEDLALARGEVALEERSMNSRWSRASVISSISTWPLPATRSPKRGRVAVLPLDRGIQRDLGRGHPPGGADAVRRVVERDRDFLVGGLAAQLLGEEALRPRHADQREFWLSGMRTLRVCSASALSTA